MNVSINNKKETKSFYFPRLMKWKNDSVVLITEANDDIAVGIMLYPNSNRLYLTGDILQGEDTIDMEELSDFTGELIMKNDD